MSTTPWQQPQRLQQQQQPQLLLKQPTATPNLIMCPLDLLTRSTDSNERAAITDTDTNTDHPKTM